MDPVFASTDLRPLDFHAVAGRSKDIGDGELILGILRMGAGDELGGVALPIPVVVGGGVEGDDGSAVGGGGRYLAGIVRIHGSDGEGVGLATGQA